MPSGIKKIFATPLSAVNTSAKEELGTIRFEGNDVYKYVKIRNVTATVAGVAGDPVAYRVDEYDAHHVVLDITDADTIPIGAGCIQGTVTGTLATDYFGWIKIKGLQAIPTALAGTPAVGDDVGILATDKTLNRRLWAGTTPTIQALVARMGTVKHVANKEVILDCPF